MTHYLKYLNHNILQIKLGSSQSFLPVMSDIGSTVEPHYNEDLGTMKITLLYQVSRYIRETKQQRKIRAGTSKITLL